MGQQKYGRIWPDAMTEFNIELAAFKMGLDADEGGLGKEAHFKNIVNALWGPHNEIKKFIWHPWAEKMVWAACNYDSLAVAGCASSAKTDTFAVWAIVNFLCDPVNTMVLVTSTSLKDSRKRIWGSIREYWLSVPGLPGKLVDSHGIIRLDDGSGDSAYSEKCGITLIAGEKKKEREAVGKLIGMKNKRVFLIADELSELSEGILGACANLASNPYFQIIGISNPNSYYDPFGILAKPKNGWASINESDDEWETENGYAIRFDAEKSPNVLAGEVVYPWLPTLDKLNAAKAKYGEKSVFYFRMYRGFWCPLGSEQAIYTEADLIKFKADTPAVWHSGWTKLVTLDPGFTNGGDQSAVMIGLWGLSMEGRMTLMFSRYEYLQEDVTNKTEPRNFQIARAFINLCEKEHVLPANTAIDVTGAGNPFCDIVSFLWDNNDFLRVHFGGKASDRPVSSDDPTPSHEKYANRVSEIWYAGHEFLRSGQLRGIMPTMAKEMTARFLEVVKGNGARIKVESKIDMKSRTGESPNVADSGFIMLDLIRERFGASDSAAVTDVNAGSGGTSGWTRAVSRFRVGVKSLKRGR